MLLDTSFFYLRPHYQAHFLRAVHVYLRAQASICQCWHKGMHTSEHARPSPWLAPVTTQTFPSSRLSKMLRTSVHSEQSYKFAGREGSKVV